MCNVDTSVESTDLVACYRPRLVSGHLDLHGPVPPGTDSIYWCARGSDRGIAGWVPELEQYGLGHVPEQSVALGAGRGDHCRPFAHRDVNAGQPFAGADVCISPEAGGTAPVGALLWEGLVYGMAEGLLLSVLPVLITWQALSSLHWTASWYGIILSGIIALLASVVVIVVHHLGYREFRGRKLVFAVAGCAPLSLAYLLTMNPLAAGVGHSILHMGAVLRGIELPPHYEKRGHVVGSVMPAH